MSQNLTKTQLIESLVTSTALDKKTVVTVLDGLATLVESTLKNGDGLTIPDVAKLSVKEKPATVERQGINPFTKQPITIAAKPATKKVVLKPAPSLKKALA